MHPWTFRTAVALLGLWAARQYYRNWGTTKGEAAMALPGDRLIRSPGVQMTDGISIDVAAEDVWPWLAQIGQDRGGFYSHESVERLLGTHIIDTDRIHPHWQQLAVGDEIRFAPRGWMRQPEGIVFTVDEVEHGQTIVLHARSATSAWDTVVCLYLQSCGKDRARLLIRMRTGLRHPGQVLLTELLSPLAAYLIRGMLQGIKQRAELRAATLEPSCAAQVR